jgi:hypothetical protein
VSDTALCLSKLKIRRGETMTKAEIKLIERAIFWIIFTEECGGSVAVGETEDPVDLLCAAMGVDAAKMKARMLKEI